MLKTIKIPEATIIRLSAYSRYLGKINKSHTLLVSSEEIARSVGVNPYQVRKDLAYFGDFGTRGVGYLVESLNKQLMKILNLNVEWNIALVGFGRLGHALAVYPGFRERGFVFKNIFDNDPGIIGTQVNGVEILPIEGMEEVIRGNQIRMGIIATPGNTAQEIADTLIRAGVDSILNFAPVNLNVETGVQIRNVDLAVNLELLSFNLTREGRGPIEASL